MPSLRTHLIRARVYLPVSWLVDLPSVEAQALVVAAGTVVHAHEVGALPHLREFASSFLGSELLRRLLVDACPGWLCWELVAGSGLHVEVAELGRGVRFELVNQVEHLGDVDLPGVVFVKHLEDLQVLLPVQVELVRLG